MSEGPLVLEAHPAARRPALAAVGALAVGAVGGAAWAALPEPGVVVPLLGALTLSLAPFYLPARYRFDEQGLEVRRGGVCRRLRWARFCGARAGAAGVELIPAGGGRGELLPLDPGGVERALPWLRRRLGPVSPSAASPDAVPVRRGGPG